MATNEELNRTILFLPERLNRQPPVFKGMTVSELFAVVGVLSAIGVVVGIFLMIVGFSWVMIPSGILVVNLVGVKFAGMSIQRLKRGKPDAWFERYLDFKLHTSKYITQEQHWRIRRINKPLLKVAKSKTGK